MFDGTTPVLRSDPFAATPGCQLAILHLGEQVQFEIGDLAPALLYSGLEQVLDVLLLAVLATAQQFDTEAAGRRASPRRARGSSCSMSCRTGTSAAGRSLDLDATTSLGVTVGVADNARTCPTAASAGSGSSLVTALASASGDATA